MSSRSKVQMTNYLLWENTHQNKFTLAIWYADLVKEKTGTVSILNINVFNASANYGGRN